MTNLEGLKKRRGELRGRLVWDRREAEEYRRLEGFLRYAERLERAFGEMKYENIKSC
jgi:hypothetical protein